MVTLRTGCSSRRASRRFAVRFFCSLKGVTANQANREKRQRTRYGGRDVGRQAAPATAEGEHGSGEKQPAGDLDQVAEGKQQHEDEQTADPVVGHALLQESQIELPAQAGPLEGREQDRQKERDDEQSFVGVHRCFQKPFP